MNILDYFVCPYCGTNSILLLNIKPLMSDTRMDTFKCEKCETMWNLYSKISEAQIDVIFTPQQSNEETKEEPHD